MLRKLMLAVVLTVLTIPFTATAQVYSGEPWVQPEHLQDVEDSGLDAQMEPSQSGQYCWFYPGGSCAGSMDHIDGVGGGANCNITNVNGYRQGNCADEHVHCTLWETSTGSLNRTCCDPDNMGGHEVCWRAYDLDECADVYYPSGVFSHRSCA